MKIKSITVTLLAPMSDHAANRGEKLLGNASSIKRRPDGRVYISGQMQRHALFSAIDRLNEDHPQRNGTYVANGDGPSTNVAKDLRSDLGGYLDTNKDDYSGRRTAPATATPGVAQATSQIGRDLLVRLRMDESKDSGRKQALATNEYSQNDLMQMSFHLDVGAVGVTKEYKYETEAHVATTYKNHLEGQDGEHARRVRLFLDATRSITDYANQARNATTAEPQKVLIVLDTKMSRKAVRYFAPGTNATEKTRILAELDNRDAIYFLGDDTNPDTLSVDEAYQQALAALDTNDLYTPVA
ncbi:type I-PGING CRISPR-associated protein Cas7/Csp1 [Spirosoma pollinicola]|uniref:Type I-PGING CRISPR-associated protein Cas7/Csp1 n=1 Tax=Spirosoma pollinicola TaxID=2057025 RepID=A0A2K8ZA71_9BACT|nr:type I-PGING CRISPR-associated protein Cas7/Csp1 [Spirosoma pollinicola]AUD06729.1 type I-PGING CRISPR-associated protein Cas7/Csp1 [Spirosoma pollinicola]